MEIILIWVNQPKKNWNENFKMTHLLSSKIHAFIQKCWCWKKFKPLRKIGIDDGAIHWSYELIECEFGLSKGAPCFFKLL